MQLKPDGLIRSTYTGILAASGSAPALAIGMRWIELTTLAVLVVAGPPPACAESLAAERVSAGCSGGVTGGGSGGIVTRDGTILRWSKASPRDAVVEETVRSDPAEARRIFDQLERMRFTSISYNGRGSTTCSLVLYRGSSSHGVSWYPGDPRAPSSVVELALRVQELAWPID